MNSESAQFPTFRQFLWLFFMQPVTLHYRLKACGIEEPKATLLKFYFVQDATLLVESRYLYRFAFTLFFPVVPLLRLWFAHDATRLVEHQYARYMIILQFFVISIIPVTATIVFSTYIFLLLECAIDPEQWFLMAISVAFSVAFSMAKDAVEGVVKGVAGRDVVANVVFGVAGNVAIGVVIGVEVGVVVGTTVSLACSSCFLIFYLRLPFYLFEVIGQTFFYLKQRSSGEITLHRVPVLYHELSYLPHPWLTSHLLLNAEHDPQLVKRVIAACRIAPGQRRAGERALGQLQAQELLQLLQHHRFDQLVELRGEWLPGIEGAPALLLTIREMGRYLQAAHATSLPYYGLQHLDRAQQQYQALENQLLIDHSPLADAIKATLPTWQKSLISLRQNMEALTQQFLPNPFRAGDPLSPESGQEVFRGRRDLVQRIESLLVDAQQRVSIALLGPRRTGKSSLLKMLPSLLPDAVRIFFDLQDNPIDSPASFFKALAQRAQEQARRDRYLTLPPLPNGTPFESGSQWLEQLDHLAIPQRILICLDEFERLETTFPGERRELLQLMGLFRATIQHRQRVRLLISGVAPFDELDQLWSDHFINLREVRIGHLDRPTALALLTQPIPDFPPSAIPSPLAEKIFARSGGLPYLLQLYGSLLVEHLNTEKRKHAQLSDLDRVEEQVLDQAGYYFRNIVQSAPVEAHAVLLNLAEGHFPVDIDKPSRRWLQRRGLLTAEGQLAIPVLGTWMMRDQE